MAKPNYQKSTAQLDLEERQKKSYVPPSQIGKATDPQPSDTGYVNVDPVYQNYANETEKPRRAETGPEAKAEEQVYADEVDEDFGAPAEGESEVEEVDPDEEPTGSGATTSSTPTSSTGAWASTASTPGPTTPVTPPGN